MDNALADQPVAPRERILALDVLRGFAMFGVLLAYCMWSLGNLPEANWSKFDHALSEVLSFLIDGKFYTILAFLFGLGFSIQLERAPNDGKAIRRYCRRLAILAAIGLGHAILLRDGDILLPYAMTGFLLIPFRQAPNRVLISAALLIALMPYAIQALWQVSGIPIPQRPDLSDPGYFEKNLVWVRYWYETAPITWPLNLTLFLFGFWGGRNGILAKIASNAQTLRALIIGGFIFGTAVYFLRIQLLAIFPSTRFDSPAPRLLFTLHCWGISSSYVAGLLLALRTPVGVAVLRPLGAIGRMALTNYLMQAALIVPVCLMFGWFDQFTPSTALALALTLFLVVQIPFSLWWLRHFQFGPAEWVWRSLTYGKGTHLRYQAHFSDVPREV